MRRLLNLICLVPTVSPCRAADWPRWRGPNCNGVSSESPLPSRCSKTENVRWKVKIPGEGFSSPIVWGERVFLTAAIDHGEKRLLHCLDRKDGKILWTGELRHGN